MNAFDQSRTFIPTQDAAHPVDTIATMAAIIGSADSILNWNHDPNDLIRAAVELYNATAESYMNHLKGGVE